MPWFGIRIIISSSKEYSFWVSIHRTSHFPIGSKDWYSLVNLNSLEEVVNVLVAWIMVCLSLAVVEARMSASVACKLWKIIFQTVIPRVIVSGSLCCPVSKARSVAPILQKYSRRVVPETSPGNHTIRWEMGNIDASEIDFWLFVEIIIGMSLPGVEWKSKT